MGYRATAFMLLALVAALPAHAAGDLEKGRRLAVKYCGRCHVVGEQNRTGGIDSTPSFYLLAKRQKYIERLKTFYARRPHPVFVRVPGLDRLSNSPAYAAEFTIRPGDIDDLVAYVKSLEGKGPKRRRPRQRNRWQ